MNNQIKSFIACLTVIAGLTGLHYECSAQRNVKAAKAPAETKLVYSFPEGKSLEYTSKTNMYNTMDFNGQSMMVSTSVIQASAVRGTGIDNGNLTLDVRIDTVSQTTDTPQGSVGGLVPEVAGKSFKMILSPAGKEIDVSDAEKITFTTEGVQTSIAQSFIDYFPDLPSNPVKPGDSWPSDDTIKSKSLTTDINVISHAENTFAGYEKINGIECAKITSELSGTREVKAQAMGMEVYQAMKFSGTSELYFAVKEGYYLKYIVKSKINGTVEIGGAQSMSMPMTGDMVSVSWLKK